MATQTLQDRVKGITQAEVDARAAAEAAATQDLVPENPNQVTIPEPPPYEPINYPFDLSQTDLQVPGPTPEAPGPTDYVPGGGPEAPVPAVDLTQVPGVDFGAPIPEAPGAPESIVPEVPGAVTDFQQAERPPVPTVNIDPVTGQPIEQPGITPATQGVEYTPTELPDTPVTDLTPELQAKPPAPEIKPWEQEGISADEWLVQHPEAPVINLEVAGEIVPPKVNAERVGQVLLENSGEPFMQSLESYINDTFSREGLWDYDTFQKIKERTAREITEAMDARAGHLGTMGGSIHAENVGQAVGDALLDLEVQNRLEQLKLREGAAGLASDALRTMTERDIAQAQIKSDINLANARNQLEADLQSAGWEFEAAQDYANRSLEAQKIEADAKIAVYAEEMRASVNRESIQADLAKYGAQRLDNQQIALLDAKLQQYGIDVNDIGIRNKIVADLASVKAGLDVETWAKEVDALLTSEGYGLEADRFTAEQTNNAAELAAKLGVDLYQIDKEDAYKWVALDLQRSQFISEMEAKTWEMTTADLARQDAIRADMVQFATSEANKLWIASETFDIDKWQIGLQDELKRIGLSDDRAKFEADLAAQNFWKTQAQNLGIYEIMKKDEWQTEALDANMLQFEALREDENFWKGLDREDRNFFNTMDDVIRLEEIDVTARDAAWKREYMTAALQLENLWKEREDELGTRYFAWQVAASEQGRKAAGKAGTAQLWASVFAGLSPALAETLKT